MHVLCLFFFSSRRRHTRLQGDWSSDVCSSDLAYMGIGIGAHIRHGSGPAINGTFVQDALNEITAGLNGTIGAEIGAEHWRVTVDARGGLSGGLSPGSPRPRGIDRWAGVGGGEGGRRGVRAARGGGG